MDTNQLIEFAGNHPVLVMALAGILLMLILSEIQQRLSKTKDVSPAEATRLLNHENAVLIDMRGDKDYREGHIVNALNAPLADGKIPASLEKYRDKPVIVYCQRGQRSGGYCNQLGKQGFETVYNLHGGLIAWQKADLPLTKTN
jgi:rhodanese-related sulfurtransferase